MRCPGASARKREQPCVPCVPCTPVDRPRCVAPVWRPHDLPCGRWRLASGSAHASTQPCEHGSRGLSWQQSLWARVPLCGSPPSTAEESGHLGDVTAREGGPAGSPSGARRAGELTRAALRRTPRSALSVLPGHPEEPAARFTRAPPGVGSRPAPPRSSLQLVGPPGCGQPAGPGSWLGRCPPSAPGHR